MRVFCTQPGPLYINVHLVSLPLPRVEVLNPFAIKNIIGMYRRRGSNPPLLYDPGWVVWLVVVEDVCQRGRRQ